MKHFMQPKNPILRENHEIAAVPSSPNPSSMKQRSLNRKQKSYRENTDPNPMTDYSSPSPSLIGKFSPVTKLRSPLPPRPPPSNPLKRKLSVDSVPDNVATVYSDSGVKVIVRMRPPIKDEEGEIIVQKISTDSLSVGGQMYTFDSVADTQSTQGDIFQLVGAPLVENCLAGFNSSVFAYGQTGSGKTYTIWGPTNASLRENLSSDQQGLTPRVFERLFARIHEEQTKHSNKQLLYQCRCSFLEIYNEQITDLLDPSQGNLQIREDVKTGVYVENLSEECVLTMKDVTKLLIKGLANRRTGATSINSESSRSHSVFTCVVESRCKSMADGLSCCKTSRINLVDLAGSERQKLTGAAGERLKEAGNINRSLSQLGNLINILAEISQTGKQRHIPYRDSKLTFLLQESLGGNAKLAMICAISPAQSCKSETSSTLRFAQRAKAVKNKAVVNEEMQDDVNVLREVIRQLKDELLRIKANGNQNDPNGGYSSGWSARRSLNLLKFSLNRPMMLPHVDDDSDEEMEIVEEVDQICEENNTIGGVKLETAQVNSQLSANKDGRGELQLNTVGLSCCEEKGFEDTDVNMEEAITRHVDKDVFGGESDVKRTSCPKTDALDKCSCIEENNDKILMSSIPQTLDEQSSQNPTEDSLDSIIRDMMTGVARKSVGDNPMQDLSKSLTEVSACHSVEDSPCSPIGSANHVATADFSIVPSDKSPVLKSPTPSVSPLICSSRKSLRTSSMLAASQKDLGDGKLVLEAVHLSFPKSSKSSCSSAISTQGSKSHFGPTKHLVASLHRGLQIIENHRQSLALRQSAYRFSYKLFENKPTFPIHKVDAGVQTFIQDLDEEPKEFLCSKCKNRNSEEVKDASDSSNLQLVPVEGSQSSDKSMKQVPKAVEKVLAGAIRREMALEEFSAKQTSEIMQLNRLVQQYKHERECNAIIGQMREDKIARLESLMDGVLSTEEFMEDELISLTNEHKLLVEKYENHPEVLRTKIELQRVQEELERYRNFFDMGERDVLVEEIHDLRSQLQYYVDSSPKSSRKRSPLLQITNNCEPSIAPPLCIIPESTQENAEQKLELERAQWTETEVKWISLVEELKSEVEASRLLAEKQKRELDMEKRCSEELKEAMQMAMEGHARMLEQYAELEEKHMHLLVRHRKIQDGIEHVKKAATRAGVRGAESKFINALAAEISALKLERERERRYLRDENKGLQAQLRDTAEAVEAAGELLVRLKEAEEAVAAAEMRAAVAEQETEKAYKQINKLRKKNGEEIRNLKQLLVDSPLSKEVHPSVYDDSDMAKNVAKEPHSTGDHQCKEFETLYNAEEELSKIAEPSSWFSGYDRCNI